MNEGAPKKQYEKPSVKKVKLVMDEAVLQHCKTYNGDRAGRGGGNRYCGHPGCKNTIGS
jgi:hypothetical protein